MAIDNHTARLPVFGISQPGAVQFLLAVAGALEFGGIKSSEKQGSQRMTMGSGRQKVRKSYLAKALGVHRSTVLRRSIRRSCRIALKRRNRDGSYSGFPMVENNSPCLIARRLIFNRASCRLFPSLHCSRIGFQLRYELIEGGPASARRSTDL